MISKIPFILLIFPNQQIPYFVNIRTLDQLRLVVDEETFESFNNLLNNQMTMDLLVIKIKDLPRSTRLSLRQDFKLRCLFIESSGCSKSRKALKLALRFKNHIECLSLELSDSVHNSLDFAKILDNFKPITALRTDIMLPGDETFYTCDRVNTKLTDLVFTSFDDGYFDDVTGLINLFKVFPNLQNLTVPFRESHDGTASTMKILELNKKLEKLKTFTVAVLKASDISFPNPPLTFMTGLFIDYIDYPVPWDAFTSNFPCLTEIFIINVEPQLDLEFFLKSQPKLTSLRLGNDFCLTLECLEVIKRCAPSLRTLRVSHWDDDVNLPGALMALDITQIDVSVVEIPENNFDAEFSQRGVFKMD